MAKMASALVVVSVLLLGLLAEGASPKQPAKLMLMRSVSANNGTGVLASGNRAAAPPAVGPAAAGRAVPECDSKSPAKASGKVCA
jgi:hypothetical protein